MENNKIFHVLGNGDFSREFVSFADFDEKLVKYYSKDEVYKLDFSEFKNNPNSKVYIAIGNVIYRKKIYDYIKSNGLMPNTFIHPSVLVGKRTSIGVGCIIQPNTIISNDVNIKNSVLINCNSNIGHDVVVGNHSSIMTNVNLGGHVKLDNEVFIGTGSTLIPSVKVKSNVTIGAGSIVVNDLKEPGSYFGNPAKLFFTKKML